MKIDGQIYGDAKVITRFERFPSRLRQELRVAVQRAGFRVQRTSKESKLSGQVLKVQTGRLRRSVNVRVTEEATAVQATVGTNVSYARPHEYGFQGVVTVREHLRRAKTQFKASLVRSHTRRVDMPARSFLRSALADQREAIRREFEQAVDRVNASSR